MTDFHPAEKLIAVSDKSGYTIAILKDILARCGRSCYHVAPAGEPVPSGMQPAVLLLFDAEEAADTTRFAKCVADYGLAVKPELAALQPVTYSTDSDNADFTARNIRRMPEGFISFEIVGVGVIGRVRLAVPSESSVKMALAAAAAAIVCGVPFAEVLDALNNIKIQN